MYHSLCSAQDGTQKSQKVFVNIPTEVGATEAEEIGRLPLAASLCMPSAAFAWSYALGNVKVHKSLLLPPSQLDAVNVFVLHHIQTAVPCMACLRQYLLPDQEPNK